MRIPRHEIDRVSVQSRFDQTIAYLPAFISSVGRTPNNLTLLASNALDIAACASVVDPDSPRIEPCLLLASRAIAALFAVATAAEFPVVDGPPTVYRTRPDASLLQARRWLDGFYLAAISRDYDSIQTLFETPGELLLRSSTRCAEYVYAFVNSIQGYLESATDTGKRIVRAMAATDPERPDINSPDWTLKIDVPAISLFFSFATGDRPGFAAALTQAVELHRSYWSMSEDEDASRDPSGFLSLGPLAFAALASDRSMPFTVDSDYVPLSIVRK
jgi:hypothetical protein